MAGFVRRYSAFPPLPVIAQIEGVVIVDIIPAGAFVGIAQGTLGLAGEWSKGPFNAPTEVTGDAGIRSTFGPFVPSLVDPLSPTTNQYSNGNAFVWLKDKKFSRLILVRPNLALSSVASTATASITLGGTLPNSIGTPGFTATVTTVTASIVYTATINGNAITFNSGGAPTAITIAAGLVAAINASTLVNGAVIAAANGTGGYTVVAVAANSTFTMTVDANQSVVASNSIALAQGTTFVLAAGTRIFNAAAPTQEFALAQDIVWGFGLNTSIAGTTAWPIANQNPLVNPLTTPTVTGVPVYSTLGVTGTATLVTSVNASDLLALSGVGSGGAYPSLTVTVANPNALTVLSSAAIDTAYVNALNATQPGADPANAIQIIAAARQSAQIRTQLQSNAVNSSAAGLGRVALLRAPIGTQEGYAAAQLFAGADPGVGAFRSDRCVFCYPHFVQFIPDVVNYFPTTPVAAAANVLNAQPGQVLVGPDSLMASLLSQLPPENNPGQATDLIEIVQRLEDGLVTAGQPTNFQMADYIAFKANGVAALRRDTRIGRWVFESGITTVNPNVSPVQVPIARRRFADFVQDSIAAISMKYNKLPATQDRKDTFTGEVFDFLDTLEAKQNPAQQRIVAFSLDSKTGNTVQLAGLGIFVLIITVQQVGTLDVIVLQTAIGPSVTVEASP
ncbi:MAG: hypothetical protein EPN91_05435 [Salinibacterium sp.]|nr:MAG: hypothetical protein EPN91_05435 [Salinibacterium sp.]